MGNAASKLARQLDLGRFAKPGAKWFAVKNPPMAGKREKRSRQPSVWGATFSDGFTSHGKIVTFRAPAARYGCMKIQMIIRRFAGTFVLASLVLAHYQSPNWLWFTACVGFNLLQSSFKNFCPLEIVLKKMGGGDGGGGDKKGEACGSK